ncbi:3-hydroxyacyl-[acyl-carrier-protein] dehydratase, FabZ form [Clostridiaceae bacterium JG1575]|nr:3-hydroxyacyl-[acyl-carrier-protein] dehydratase, FabZ form [Clostridiaceae bacterium JG1575]
MNREALKRIMPHREPMLLLDEAVVVNETTAHATVRLRGDEFFLQGHFPGNPVLPGVIQCEMMAQACAVLLGEGGKKIPYFTGIREAKFRAPIRPGDLLKIEAVLTRTRAPFYFAKAQIRVANRLAAEAEISFALMEDT